jgi:hypothetical protein
LIHDYKNDSILPSRWELSGYHRKYELSVHAMSPDQNMFDSSMPGSHRLEMILKVVELGLDTLASRL